MLYLNLSALQTKTWVVTEGGEKAVEGGGGNICDHILELRTRIPPLILKSGTFVMLLLLLFFIGSQWQRKAMI